MMELFDMGKYDFFVWGSIGVFIVALVVDFISANNRHKNIKKQINAHLKRKQTHRKQVRRKQT